MPRGRGAEARACARRRGGARAGIRCRGRAARVPVLFGFGSRGGDGGAADGDQAAASCEPGSLPTVEDGVRGLALIEAALRSAATGSWVDCRVSIPEAEGPLAG